MMMNSLPGSSLPLGEVPQDAVVYDVNGEKVGKVIFSAMRDGYFVVEQGWLFSHQYFLPPTAIQARTAEGITLRLSKEDLKEEQWKQPPIRTSPAPADSVMPANDPSTEAGRHDEEVINLPPPEAEPPLANR
jgi:hypothetical protein